MPQSVPKLRYTIGVSASGSGVLSKRLGKTVTVIVRDHDRYKRTVAEIILPDGRNLNREIVRAGFAWWFVRYARHDTALRDFETKAREAKRGLWADPNPTPPWEWRKAKKNRP